MEKMVLKRSFERKTAVYCRRLSAVAGEAGSTLSKGILTNYLKHTAHLFCLSKMDPAKTQQDAGG